MFHAILAREHNYIIESLNDAYPELTSDQKYGGTRLYSTAILAKIYPGMAPYYICCLLKIPIGWTQNAVSGLFSTEELKETINSIKIASVMTTNVGTNLTILNTPFQNSRNCRYLY